MDALLEQAVQGMKKNGFEVVEVRTAAEACDYLLAHIDAEKSVGVGGSVSVRDTGVLPALAQKGCKVYTSWGAKPEDVPMIREPQGGCISFLGQRGHAHGEAGAGGRHRQSCGRHM